jgi:hypothetical protein
VTWRGWTAFVALGILWGLPYFFIKLDEHLGAGGHIAFVLIVLGSWLATRGAVTRRDVRNEATVGA